MRELESWFTVTAIFSRETREPKRGAKGHF